MLPGSQIRVLPPNEAGRHITVGIGYAGDSPDCDQLRRWDLSPVPFGDDGRGSGHAPEFLTTIETVVIPFVEKEYRAEPSSQSLPTTTAGVTAT